MALLGTFSKSVMSEVSLLGLGIVNSVLMVRFLGAELTGYYLLLMAAIASAPALLNALDQALTRFIPATNDGATRTALALGVIVSKLYGTGALLLVGMPLIFLLWPQWAPQTTAPTSSVWLWICALCNFWLLPVWIGWSSRLIASYQDYGFQIGADLLTGICNTVWLGLALLAFDIRTLLPIMTGFTLVMGISIVVRFARIQRHDPDVPRQLPGALLKGGHVVRVLFAKRHRQYFAPFFLTAVSGMLKDLVPLLAVGVVSPAQTVAEFRIVQQIFRLANGIVPNAFELVRPSLVLLRSARLTATTFFAKYSFYALLYLLAATAFALVICWGLEYILALWSLSPNTAVRLVAIVMALELLFGVATHVEYQIFLLKERTGYLVLMSVMRQLITAAGMFAGGVYWGPVGVAAGPAAGALSAWLGFAAYGWGTGLRPRRDLLKSFAMTWCCCGIVIAAGALVIRSH